MAEEDFSKQTHFKFTTIRLNDRKTDNRIPLLPIDAAQYACAAYYQHVVRVGIAGG